MSIVRYRLFNAEILVPTTSTLFEVCLRSTLPCTIVSSGVPHWGLYVVILDCHPIS
jgi:hypothetical protein